MNPVLPILRMIDVLLTPPSGEHEQNSVRWELYPGEFWVIGGVHGSGRTDFISTAAGLQHPLRGRVELFGTEIRGKTEKQLLEHRLRLGVVFEHGGRLFPGMTVAENVALPLRYHRNWSFAEATPLVNEVLKRCELERQASARPSTLSLGWQLRVGLARVLTLEPQILLLDKPFSTLEWRHRKWWFDFIAQFLNNDPESRAVAVTTDDLNPWLDQANRFAWLEGNHLRDLGSREMIRGKNVDRMTGNPEVEYPSE